MASSSDWQFVISDGPKVPKDPTLRTMIRKQAMKDVAIARKQRNKQNRKASPQPSSPEDDTSTSTPDEAPVLPRAKSTSSSSGSEFWSDDVSNGIISNQEGDEGPAVDFRTIDDMPDLGSDWFVSGIQDWALSPRPTLLQLPYDELKSRYAVDITELGVLTGFNVSSDTIIELAGDPSRMISLLGTRHINSFLDYIPARYGKHPALTAAVDCVAAGLQRKLIGRAAKEDPMAMRQYAKALKELQTVIANESACDDPDVLCAVQLMGIHEIIEGSRTSAYRNHVNGAAQIVRHRTSTRFTSDFEQTLFLGHIGPIVMEAIKLGSECYLASPEWLALWKSMIDHTPGPLNDRSELAINLRVYLCHLPSVLASLIEVITGPKLFDDFAMLQLRKQVKAYAQELVDWSNEYKAYCVRSSLAQPSHEEIALRRELFGGSLECLTFVKRLLAAVCDEQRHDIEVEVQALAQLIFNMQAAPGPQHAFLFSRHERNVAQLVTMTHDDWVEDTSGWSKEENLLAIRKRIMRTMWFMTHGWGDLSKTEIEVSNDG